ncbi:ABC transporter ATP-binding protein [Emergencia timonensis]|uniref:ABC transporter ATP-binding protein n=1 Tax=Emergencia timonensis TaxID=1776384 RepID=UPI00399405E0
MNAPLLETVNLKKYFKTSKGNLHAVDNINLQVAEGSTLGIVGESGCGKSTLGRTILRLTEPTEGQILFEGNDICKLSKKGLKDLRKSIQIIFQDPFSSLDPRKCVLDLIAEPLLVNKKEYSKSDVYAKAYDLMDTVGLAERLAYSYPHELDGGRRQRIGIARALSLEPKFIVCDEPVSALDVSIQAQILNLLMDLQEEMGLTYLFITHNLSAVKHISDEIAVLYLGQCVEKAPTAELFRSPQHPYTKALLSAVLKPNLNERGRLRNVIHGEVTSPIDPAPGCRFAARCPYRTEKCMTADVMLRDVGAGHQVACVLAEN